jgi:hypothetical protein
MQALLLSSILIATVAIPVRAARDPSARRGLRRAVLQMVLFSAAYTLACAFVYHRLF